MSTPEKLLASGSGLVVAPAGCGKTRLLVDTIIAASGGRTLVLTHTRAGVAVIKTRLTCVKSSQYRVATLDTWCSWLACGLPGLSKFVPTGMGTDYDAAKRASLRVLKSDAIRQALAATYDRVLVDEYQDCSRLQHEIIVLLKCALPVIAFGDHMQHVFDFSDDGTPVWSDVCASFEDRWDLETPWRWNQVNEHEFGEWVLQQRSILEAGGQVDLRSGPPNVKWRPLPADGDLHRRFHLYSLPKPTSGTTLFVLNDRSDTLGRRSLAREAIRLAVVERADLPDLQTWAGKLERATGTARTTTLLHFAHDVMTGVDISATVAALNLVIKNPDPHAGLGEERSLIELARHTDMRAYATVLTAMAGKRTVHRPEMLEALCEAAVLAGKDTTRTLTEAAAYVREKRANGGRKLGARSIGSTLLLKGMEADHTVVLDADKMKPRDLYVAISRASRSLTVVSRSPVLPIRRT